MSEKIDELKDGKEEVKAKMKNYLDGKTDAKANILITGATGVGKSSTINALFDMQGKDIMQKAKVGNDGKPQTSTLEKYELGNLTIWDSPGLGDGAEKDEKYAEQIRDLLQKMDDDNQPLIDLALVILDASHRDLGTAYNLINRVVIPYLGTHPEKRLIIALNQADKAYNNPKKAWDWEENRPTVDAAEFLSKKVSDIQERIEKDTGVRVNPIYYTAGCLEKDEDGKLTQNPWNISKLLYYIVEGIRPEKRQMLEEHLTKDASMLFYSDNSKEAREQIAALEQRILEEGEKARQEREQIIAQTNDAIERQRLENEHALENMRLQNELEMVRMEAEYSKAMAKAAEQNKGGGIGKMLKGLLGGAGGGAATGAAIGSIIPGIGTAIGALGGAVIGGLGGAAAGANGDDVDDVDLSSLSHIKKLK